MQKTQKDNYMFSLLIIVNTMSSKKATERKEKLKKEEAIALVEMLAELMNAYAAFSGNLGKIQKANEEAYKSIFSLETMSKFPEVLTKIMEEEPPELSRLIVSILSKMTAFLPQISGIMGLSADDKIKLGENLKSLAKDFKKLLEWVEKENE